MIGRFDLKEIYCRKLGHCLTFAYCRVAQTQQPCRSIRDCWIGKLPIQEFLETHFEEQLEQILAPPVPKIASLQEIVERVERRLKPENQSNRVPTG
jgi:hypothetical protein